MWNKVDKLNTSEKIDIECFAENTQMIQSKAIVSAKTGTGFETLLQLIETFFNTGKKEELIFVPFEKSKERAWLLANNLVIQEKVVAKGSEMFVSWTERQKGKFLSDGG